MKRIKSPARLRRDHYLRMADVFRAAQSFLRTQRCHGGSQFICHAIEYTNKSIAARRCAKDIVMERIAPHRTIETWLAASVAGIQKEAENVPFETIQDYRRRWLKTLEAEFANKGL